MPIHDDEGAMARSELYRAAKYSMKLFEMISEEQQLEGWVQSKITKAADYLDSVYHYMEYQMKFGGGEEASHIDDITGDAEADLEKEPISDMDDEEELKEGLTYEEKLKALLEGKIEKSGVRASDKKKGKVDKSERKIYFVKLEKEGKMKGVTTQAEEGESQGEVRDRVKRENMGWSVASIREKDSIDEAAEMVAKKKEKKVKESSTKCNESPKGKMCPVHGLKECGMYEDSVVSEKAVSKAQQQAAGVALAAKRKGEKPAGKGASAEMAKMSTKELEKFAGTKHKGLPAKKEKADESLVKSIVKKVVEAKKKKPDADGDGVPDWADKKPGKDDNAEKGSKPKKGVVPPQFAKKKETVKESVELNNIKRLAGI